MTTINDEKQRVHTRRNLHSHPRCPGDSSEEGLIQCALGQSCTTTNHSNNGEKRNKWKTQRKMGTGQTPIESVLCHDAPCEGCHTRTTAALSTLTRSPHAPALCLAQRCAVASCCARCRCLCRIRIRHSLLALSAIGGTGRISLLCTRCVLCLCPRLCLRLSLHLRRHRDPLLEGSALPP